MEIVKPMAIKGGTKSGTRDKRTKEKKRRSNYTTKAIIVKVS